MNDWKEATLQDLASEVTVGHVGPMAQHYQEKGIPFLRSLNVEAHSIDLEDVKYISDEFHTKLQKSMLRPGDVVTVRTGKPGTTSVIPEDLPMANCSDLVITRPGPKLDARWFSYYMNSAGSSFVDAQLVGAVQQHFNVGSAKAMRILLPPLRQQVAIAEVLGALDDKIATNTKLAATAEELMHASFQDLLRNKTNRSVSVASLVRRVRVPEKINVAEIQAHGDIPVFDQGALGHLGYISKQTGITAAPDAPRLFFGDHTCKLGIVAENFALGPNTIPFEAQDIPTIVLYCALQGVQRHEEYKRHWSTLLAKEVKIPSYDEAQAFANQQKNTLSLLITARRENEALAAARDALLPQLISGNLRVRGV